MSQEKKTNKLAIVLAVLLTVSLVANVALGILLVKEINDPVKSLYDPEYALGRNDPPVTAEGTEPEVVEEIPLQLIELDYPGELKDRVVVDTQEDENGVYIVFTTDVSGKTFELFSFRLTRTEDVDGYLMGTLEDPQKGTFYVAMNVVEPIAEEWSEEEYNEICSLQERVNDIIVQFYEDARFVPSR